MRSGPLNGMWKGGQFSTPDGRIMLMAKTHPRPSHVSGYVLRSRLVMEKHLGRILSTQELVHHKNGIKDDDRIENLEIVTRSEHVNLHREELNKSKVGTYLLGERHPNARFTVSDILEMRRLRFAGNKIKDIAIQFKAVPAVVSRICLGKSWRHLP